jgi:dephospho-CoA kinase
MEDNIIIVGITGGIGSGKSTVSEFYRELGYSVLNSDKKAKELYLEDKELKAKLIKEFGDDFYLPDGNINKEFIGNMIFGESEESNDNLTKLNSLVHPLVIQSTIDEIDRLVEEGEYLIFVESALIFETNMQDAYNFVICVISEQDKVIERLLKRGNLTEEKIIHRISNQISPEEKKKKSDFVINNNSTIEALQNSARFIIDIISPEDSEEED